MVGRHSALARSGGLARSKTIKPRAADDLALSRVSPTPCDPMSRWDDIDDTLLR
jgi:hypothetical protein